MNYFSNDQSLGPFRTANKLTKVYEKSAKTAHDKLRAMESESQGSDELSK